MEENPALWLRMLARLKYDRWLRDMRRPLKVESTYGASSAAANAFTFRAEFDLWPITS